MKSLLKLWALLVPLALMGSFGGGSFSSASSISASGKGMQGAQGGGDSTPTPDFSLYNIASGPSQLAGTATYNGTELTTVLECFGEGFDGTDLVCETGGTWTKLAAGATAGGWDGAWSDASNEPIDFSGTADQRIEGPSADVIDAVSGKEVFLEVVFRPSITNETGGLIDFRDESGTGHGTRLYMQSGNMRADIITSAGSSGYQSAAVTALAWNHGIGVMNPDASTGSVVVAGVNGAASLGGGSAVDGTISGTTGLPAIGDLANGAGTYQFNGSIAYVAIRTCTGCVVDESGNTTTDEWIAKRFAKLNGTYATDGTDKIPTVATRASAGYACHFNASGVRKCDQVGDNWVRTWDVADTGLDDASATHTTGLLIEEARTNIAANSQNMGGGSWTPTGIASLGASSTGAPIPDGERAWVADTSTSHYSLISAAVSSGTQYAVSFIGKAGAESWVRMNSSSTRFGSAVNVYADLASCSIGTTSNDDDSGAEDWGDGWCRVWFTDTATSTGTNDFRIFLAEGDNDSTFAGDDSTVTMYSDHYQIEAGAYPSSPIVTEGSTVTRSADALEYDASDTSFSGTMAFAFVTDNTDQSTSRYLAEMDDGSNNNRVILRERSSNVTQCLIQSGGASTADLQGNDDTDGLWHTGRCEYATDDFDLITDGSSVATDTSGAIPAGTPSEITVGTSYGASSHGNAVISCLALYTGQILTDDGVCQ
jgi:hypothetical protein